MHIAPSAFADAGSNALDMLIGPGISEPDQMLVFGKIWREILP
jgi:hypothetical protein